MQNIQKKEYYAWIDNLKLFACICVVMGHIFMALATAKMIDCTHLYNWFVQTVYTFHVQLFFVCSGFLYQKSNRVHDLCSWKNNAINKLINLGVPYFVFTAVTFIMKYVFSNDVNSQMDKGFLYTIFISPTAPYWYLYVLFFMFLLVPNLKSKNNGIILMAISFVFVLLYFISRNYEIPFPYIVYQIFAKLIWFAFGMFLTFFENSLNNIYIKISSVITLAVAIILSVLLFPEGNDSIYIFTLISILFVYSFTMLFANFETGFVNKVSQRFSKYFMPVFLMHTIFAAGTRILLLRIGISNVAIHIIFDSLASFAIPMLIYKIVEPTPLLFFFQPVKAVGKWKSNLSKKN